MDNGESFIWILAETLLSDVVLFQEGSAKSGFFCYWSFC